ncbi:hypothetical protein QCA50_020095 [Cerrena zonata]|uniref:Uncharacterized protein n=1 Tax=Cerrena zonata TaxID=2478898 RepID=A0AAW0FIG3_9APHY
MGAASGAQPSKVSRFIGEAEKTAGELTNNQNLVQKGAIRSAGGTKGSYGTWLSRS